MMISYSTGNVNTIDSDKCIAKHERKSSVAVKSQGGYCIIKSYSTAFNCISA